MNLLKLCWCCAHAVALCAGHPRHPHHLEAAAAAVVMQAQAVALAPQAPPVAAAVTQTAGDRTELNVSELVR